MNELKLDIDNKNSLKQLIFAAKKLVKVWKIKGLKIKSIKCYETKKGFHIYIKLNKNLDVFELLLYQCLLGSDLKRETHNLYNLYFNLNRFNYLAKFKKIYEDGVIYESKERVTKKSNRILRRLAKILMEVVE